MNLSLRAATVLLPLLLHDAQSAAEQISGRHLRRNDKRSSSSLGLEESDKVSEMYSLTSISKYRTWTLQNISTYSTYHLFLLYHTDYVRQ